MLEGTDRQKVHFIQYTPEMGGGSAAGVNFGTGKLNSAFAKAARATGILDINDSGAMQKLLKIERISISLRLHVSLPNTGSLPPEDGWGGWLWVSDIKRLSAKIPPKWKTGIRQRISRRVRDPRGDPFPGSTDRTRFA